MARGGKRKGAGRPRGTGKFGEPTKAIRLPISMIDRIMEFISQKGLIFPVYTTQVQAGFPSPADDTLPETFDLIKYLIKNPPATFLVRATGDSMTGAGIFANDVLVVDKSAEASNDDIVIAVVNNEFTVKRLVKKDGRIELKAENPAFSPIIINDEQDLNIWGVVKHVIHEV